MASDPKAREVMEWQGGEEGNKDGDALSSTAAPSVGTTVTHLAQSHSADRTPRSLVRLGFLAKYGPPRRRGRRTPEPTTESLMAIRIWRVEQIVCRFDPKLTVSQHRQHLAFSSLPTDILFMAQELVTVKNQVKSGVQIVGRELARIDEQVRLLNLESQKVQESFATQVVERLGETDQRQARHEAITSHLHEAVQGTGEQSMHQYILLDQEIVRINEQHKRELANHKISSNLVRDGLRHHQEYREAQDGEIAVLKALVEQSMGQVKGKGKVSDPTPEASGVGGGRPPPPPRHGATVGPGRGGEETPMMREKELEGSQMRVEKEDATRDPRPSQKKTTMRPRKR